MVSCSRNLLFSFRTVHVGIKGCHRVLPVIVGFAKAVNSIDGFPHNFPDNCAVLIRVWIGL